MLVKWISKQVNLPFLLLKTSKTFYRRFSKFARNLGMTQIAGYRVFEELW